MLPLLARFLVFMFLDPIAPSACTQDNLYCPVSEAECGVFYGVEALNHYQPEFQDYRYFKPRHGFSNVSNFLSGKCLI